MRTFFIYIFLLCLPLVTIGQTTVRLKRSGKLTLEDIEGRKIQKLIDSVWLVQGTTNIYCDSAYLDKLSNSAQAFGKVTIIDMEDPLDIKSNYLEYDGNTRIAYLRNNVVMKDDSTTLYTDSLDYYRDNQVAKYFGGGKLVDATNDLTSRRGLYSTATKKAEFYDSVYLKNEEFDLYTDQLIYDTRTSEAITKGVTIGITDEADSLKTATGLLYNRQTRYAEIYYGRIINQDFYIEADTIQSLDSIATYKAYKNIEMISSADSLTIYGDEVIYNKELETALAYENAYFKKLIEGDSLFIKGDTLFSDQSNPENKYLTVFHDVEMFKSDMQGIADSVSYNFTDSTINMFQNPIIWAQDSQISADSIDIILVENKVRKMDLAVRSFVISRDSLEQFNQVSGRNMEVFFKEGYLERTNVKGNGETIYHVIEDNGAVTMNKSLCSDMALYFLDNSITEIRFYTEVDGALIPSPEIQATDKRLRGFKWQIERQPKLRQVALHLRYDR